MIGKTIELRGYDFIACAQVTYGGGPTSGYVLVSNASTHYLLCRVDEPDLPVARVGIIVAEFPYGERELDVFETYGRALQRMINEASRE